MESLNVIVAARNEADRIGATIDALRAAFPEAAIFVADDGSDDDTAAVAMAHGATVISRGRPHGKGANVTAAADAALDAGDRDRRLRAAVRRRPRRRRPAP